MGWASSGMPLSTPGQPQDTRASRAGLHAQGVADARRWLLELHDAGMTWRKIASSSHFGGVRHQDLWRFAKLGGSAQEKTGPSASGVGQAEAAPCVCGLRRSHQ
jgi:hypothetical protein